MFKVYKGKYQSFQYNNIICNLKYKFVILIVIRLYLEPKYDFGYLYFYPLGSSGSTPQNILSKIEDVVSILVI